MLVVEFPDRVVWALYDDDASEEVNAAFAAAVSAEGARRKKAGQLTNGIVRDREPEDQVHGVAQSAILQESAA